MLTGEPGLQYRYLTAMAALNRGDIEEARREFEILVLDYPRLAPAWDGLGNCHEADGDLDRAAACFRKAMRLDRQNWRSRYHWGVALHRAGEVRKARRWLQDASRLAPGERCILRRLGQCHLDLGDYDEAARCFRRAMEQPERDIPDALLYTEIGIAELERGEYDAADAAFERACLLSPDDPMIYYHWALLAARRGELDQAERLARRGQGLDGRSRRHPLLLIQLGLDHRRWELVESALADLGRLPATERLVHAMSAELARRRGDAAGARRIALAALTMPGAPCDQAIDVALSVLRHLRAEPERCQGFRILIEGDCGDMTYFRPYVVLAANEEHARWLVAELQDALDTCPWRIVEQETFPHPGEAVPGVYQVLLTRVLFPVEGSGLPVGGSWPGRSAPSDER